MDELFYCYAHPFALLMVNEKDFFFKLIMHACNEFSAVIGNINKLSCLGDARISKSDDSTIATITHDGHESYAFRTCSQQQCTSYNWELCKWVIKYSGPTKHNAVLSTWGSIQSNTNRTIWTCSRTKCISGIRVLFPPYFSQFCTSVYNLERFML